MMTRPSLEQLLPGLLTWLNQNLPLDPKKPLSESDIAHLSLTTDELAEIPAPMEHCEWRRARFKRYLGIEIWECRYALPPIMEIASLRGRLAWKLTSSTAALFKR
jgi:hypothetical protein